MNEKEIQVDGSENYYDFRGLYTDELMQKFKNACETIISNPVNSCTYVSCNNCPSAREYNSDTHCTNNEHWGSDMLTGAKAWKLWLAVNFPDEYRMDADELVKVEKDITQEDTFIIDGVDYYDCLPPINETGEVPTKERFCTAVEITLGKADPSNKYTRCMEIEKDGVKYKVYLDFYDIARLWPMQPEIEHSAKKHILMGNRGHKDVMTDINDCINSLERYKREIE